MVIKTDISIFFFNLRKNPIVFSYGVGVVCQEYITRQVQQQDFPH